MKNRTNYRKEHKTVQQIQKLFDKVSDLVNSLPDSLQLKLLQYHNDHATLLHCTRWGLQAAEDILEEWREITAPLRKEDEF